jgi:hypothetical protein
LLRLLLPRGRGRNGSDDPKFDLGDSQWITCLASP